MYKDLFFGPHRFLVKKQDSVDAKTFLFGLHQFLVEKQDSVDVKIFFLGGSSPNFSGFTIKSF